LNPVLNPVSDPLVPLVHADIARLIPHQGAMCLLARADRWDELTIVCHADNHRDPRHPLRSRSGLLSTCLIEYAAQAMALHGSLLARGAAGPSARPGFLAAGRNVVFACLNLDDLPPTTPDELRIEVNCEARDHRQLQYAFAVRHAGMPLAAGHITVVLDASPLAR
jgi:predicted hotdog family 3-hydroxylacyl-ACP dehydratase